MSGLPEAILAAARAQGKRMATAESCTGGMIAVALTDIAGSSDVFECGFVTYSNASKTALLGVDKAILKAFGAVSAETAQAMAEGALARSGAQVALSVTGIAGPGGGSAEKPVGLVWFGLAADGQPTQTFKRLFILPGRAQVRDAARMTGLRLIAQALGIRE